ncbi:MAG: LptF/LptG family permease [Gemmatimonadota bacterium]
MKILSRYVLKEHVGPLLFGQAVFTLVLLMNQVARKFDELARRDLDPAIIAHFFVLTLPFILAVTFPMGVLVATLAAFGRLSADNEITAMKASGVSLYELLTPLLGAAGLLALAMVWFNHAVLSESNHELSRLEQDIGRTKPTFVLREGTINEPGGAGNYRLVVERIDRDADRLYGVRIHDQSNPAIQRTIVADSGTMAYTADGRDLVLDLRSGAVYELDAAEPAEHSATRFDRQRLILREVGSELQRNRGEDDYRTDREMDFRRLLAEVREERVQLAQADSGMVATAGRDVEAYLTGDFAALDREAGAAGLEAPAVVAKNTLRGLERYLQQREYALRQGNKYAVEYHKKIAIPVACLVFVLIGASLGVRTRRSGYGFAIGVSLVIFTVYYIFLIGGEDLSDRLFISPWLAMWAPNILFTILGFYLLRRTVRESSGLPFAGLFRGRRPGARTPPPGPPAPAPEPALPAGTAAGSR